MRSNEPPCLTQNEPPCLVHRHMHASRIFFFSPLSPAQKKNNHHRKSVFKRAPCLTQRRAPCLVHRHMHASRIFFFSPLPCPKKNKSSSSQKCVQTSPRVSRRTSPVSRSASRRGFRLNALFAMMMIYFKAEGEQKRFVTHGHDDALDAEVVLAWGAGARLNMTIIFFSGRGQGGKKKDPWRMHMTMHWTRGSFSVRHGGSFERTCVWRFFWERSRGKRFVTHAWCTGHGGSVCTRHGGLVWTHFCDDDSFLGRGRGKKKDSWRMHMTMHETRGLVWTHLCVAIIFFLEQGEGKKIRDAAWCTKHGGARLNALLWWWLFFFWAGEGEKKKKSVTMHMMIARDTGARSAWDTGARLNALVCVVIIIIFFFGQGEGEGKKRFVTHAWSTRHGGLVLSETRGLVWTHCVRWWRDYLFFGGQEKGKKDSWHTHDARDTGLVCVRHGGSFERTCVWWLFFCQKKINSCMMMHDAYDNK